MDRREERAITVCSIAQQIHKLTSPMREIRTSGFCGSPRVSNHSVRPVPEHEIPSGGQRAMGRPADLATGPAGQVTEPNLKPETCRSGRWRGLETRRRARPHLGPETCRSGRWRGLETRAERGLTWGRRPVGQADGGVWRPARGAVAIPALTPVSSAVFTDPRCSYRFSTAYHGSSSPAPGEQPGSASWLHFLPCREQGIET